MNIYQMLRIDEGVKNTMYKDTEGYFTVGVGHLVSKTTDKQTAIKILDKKFNRSTNGILTDAEVEILFNEDIANTIKGIKQSSLNTLYISLDDARQLALINMVFQMGIAGVQGFTNSIKLLQEKKWEEAAVNLKKSKWFSQTPNRAGRVISVFKNGNTNAY